jgi:outer membrane protein
LDIKSKFVTFKKINPNNQIMKTIKKLLLTTAAAVCLNFAQAQKIAHLSFDSLVSLMPETKVATEAAQNYLKGLEQELVAMQTELDSKYKDYLEKEPTMSDLIKKSKQEDLQQLQNRIQDFQRQAEMEYKRKQSELTMPIMEKAKKGIEAVAKEGGYKYVLDTSPQNSAVLYSEQGDDILNAVKKKLDSMPPATIPGSKPQGTDGVKSTPGGNKPPQPKK